MEDVNSAISHGQVKNTVLEEIQKLTGASSHPLLANPNMRLNSMGHFVPIPPVNELDSTGQPAKRIIHPITVEMCYESSKVIKLLDMLRPSSPVVNHENKVVVFSSWMRFLDM